METILKIFENVAIIKENEKIWVLKGEEKTELNYYRWKIAHMNGKNIYVCNVGVKPKNDEEAIELEKIGKVHIITNDELLSVQYEMEEIEATIKARSEKEAKENIQLCVVGYTEDFGKVYAVSSRIDRDAWKKIANLMFYLGEDSEAGGDSDDRTLGWVTTQPEKVEEMLSVKPELRIKEKEKEAEIKAKKQSEINKKRNENKKYIFDAFKNAEYPEENIQPDGEKIEDSTYPENIYGGGRWFVIEKEYIWKIDNNGSDGSDWRRNNVKTGGAGAIGVRVKYDRILEEKIREYCSE